MQRERFLKLLRLRKVANTCNIRPFETDGCTAVPNALFKEENALLKCCVVHDKAYWKGGTWHEKKLADQAFKACIKGSVHPIMASIMYYAVRIGGSAFWPTPFRWGYGWPYFRGYKALDEEELKIIDHIEKIKEASV